MDPMINATCLSSCSSSFEKDASGFFRGTGEKVFSLDNCIDQSASCYFNCLNKNEYQLNASARNQITELITIGRAGAISSIIASCLFILISVYLKRYRRWIEQIILSKVACDLIYGIVLIDQFNYSPLLERKTLTHFLLIVVSLLGLVWIPVLFFEVRNVITFPFSGWGLSKLVTRWSIALLASFAWSCLCFIGDLQDDTATYVFQYVPIIYISASKGEENNRSATTFSSFTFISLTWSADSFGCFFILQFSLFCSSFVLRCLLFTAN